MSLPGRSTTEPLPSAAKSEWRTRPTQTSRRRWPKRMKPWLPPTTIVLAARPDAPRSRADAPRALPRRRSLCCKPSIRRSFLRLLQPMVDQLSHALQFIGLELAPRHELSEQQLGRSREYFFGYAVERRLPGRG